MGSLNIDILLVLAAIIVMVYLLIKEYLRPGLILFSTVVLLLLCGVIDSKDALAGFSNKGVITVAMLFLVSEGVRRSNCLSPVMGFILPTEGRITTHQGYLRILPTVASISAFLNNTPIVIIFIPHIKAWCVKNGLPLKKFLIPLSYAAILGGMCTLIGTSTNLVVHGLMLDAGLEGFTMFEIGKVGVIITLFGVGYLILFADKRIDAYSPFVESNKQHRVEVVLSSRFAGIRCTIEQFDFQKHYGATIEAVRRDGEIIEDLEEYEYKENDTLILSAPDSFIDTWGESRVFVIMTNGGNHTLQVPRWKTLLTLALLLIMVVGATISQLPIISRFLGTTETDMFFWAAVVTVIMALSNIFPAKKYTKFISWDILITIASALAISRAMTVSGFADFIASMLIDISGSISPYLLLAILYIITNIITELITNNAAAAFAFPIGLAAATKIGVNYMPFCIAIAIAASASFSTPIGYQTNMIVQGLGGYSFKEFLKIGLPLNIITFIISMIFIPLFWNF